MFVLNELDNILKNLVPPTKNSSKVDRFKVSLPEIEQLDVEQMQLALKVRYPPLADSTTIGLKEAVDLNELVGNGDKIPSLDKVFLELVYKLVMMRMMAMPERHYPSARIIVCDWPCYEMIMKFKRLSSTISSNKNSNRLLSHVSGKNLIHRKPFGTTAIFLLSDIVDIFNRQDDPIIVQRLDRSTGKPIIAYNTAIIKQTFPYLRMSDLLILLQNKKQLQLGRYSAQSSREHKIIQFLNHNARSTELIEFNSGNYRILSKLHAVYDNVILVANNDADFGQTSILFNKLQLPQISLMVQHLLQMADLLRLNIVSITYRQADLSGQTKVFSQLLATGLKTKQDGQSSDSQRRARVLVVDRFYNLISVLYHADRYGAYLEQENQYGNTLSNKLRVENMDELGEQLQLVQLTDVLSSILKSAMRLKSVEVEKNRFKNGRQFTELTPNALTTSQSIKRHLELVKNMYKSLNEGYLLMLRLETTLENIDERLKDPSLDEKQVEELGQRMEKVVSIFKQLINVPSNAIKVSDLVRIAAILLDVDNMLNLVIKLKNFKTSFKHGTIRDALDGKDFEKVIDLKQQDLGGDKEEEDEEKKAMEKYGDVRRKLARFDRLSNEFCPQKSPLTMKQMVENFDQNQLEIESFPTLNLLEDKSSYGPIILAFLGSITAHELSRIKSLAASKRLYLIAYNQLGPEDFLRTL